MRVVALVSGGKDSCFNMMQCIAAGHDIVALANLYPVGKGKIMDIFIVIYQAIFIYYRCKNLACSFNNVSCIFIKKYFLYYIIEYANLF